jgi:class 3 adenylate cyclase/tetratricopeptide (TPR) repeat protein
MPQGSRAGDTAGERKLVTILFADLSGYTALSERLDPEEVYSFLRPGMLELQAIVDSFGGSVPQIQGDGFMAVFGVPRAHEDDAERAVRAALACRDHVRTLNVDRVGLSFPDVHAGVNSGEVMVGRSDEPSGFAVVGDTVNTASRLADLARAGQIVVDERTRNRTLHVVRYGPRRLRTAKGKAAPIATFEVLGPVPTTVAARPSTGFVDREEILGVLGRELELTEQSGRARVLVVEGEPGIGKSRLADELGHSLDDDRFLVGRSAPFGDQRRLAALAQVVGGALGVAAAGGTPVATRAAIDRAARRIGRSRGVSVTAELRTLFGQDDPSARRSDRDVVHAARLVMEDAARSGPVAVVLDDLQWADPSIRELLAEAHRAPWEAPVLLLGLSREQLPELPVKRLPGLELPAMRSLAEQLLGEPGSADAVGVPLVRANGNALFLEEMVGMLVERGAVRHGDDGWQLQEPALLDEVPETVRLVIAARLDALPPDEKRLLADASVCGSTTWRALLDELSDVEVPGKVLRSVVDRGLLVKRPRSSVAGTTEYGWKHSLIRDVAYDTVPRAVRAHRHVEVAEWLRARAPKGREPIEAISWQYERAWELSRRRTGPGPSDQVAALAAEFLTRRGEQVFAQQARAAEPVFRRALRILEASGRAADPQIAARASTGLAEVLIEMGDHAEAIEQAGRARRVAERSGDGRLAARAILALGRSESDAGHLVRARRLLADARGRFEREGDLRGQGWALHRLSETWGWEGFERELADLDAAYRAFARARDRFGRSVVANDLAYILSVQGGRRFHRWYALARQLAEDEGDLRSRALLVRTWGNYSYSAGDAAEAVRAMEECRPLAVDAGDRYAECDALIVGALASANLGRLDDAASLAEEAIAIGRRLGSVRIPALARLALARASVRRGDPAAGAAALRAAARAIRSRGLRVLHGDLTEAQAMVLLDRGAWSRVPTACAELAAALEVVPMALWAPIPTLIEARAMLALGRLDRAVEGADEAWRGARAAGADGVAALATAVRAQARVLTGSSRPPRSALADTDTERAAIAAETEGIVALRRHDPAAATAAFERAVTHWETLGTTAWLARSLALRGDAYREAGDRARAAASIGRARTVADQLGMPARERAAIEQPVR